MMQLISDELRHEVWNRFDGACLGCGAIFPYFANGGWEVHHVLARRDGGSDDLDNLAMLCLSCHTLAEDTTPMPSTLWALKAYLLTRIKFELTSPKSATVTCPETWDWHRFVYGGARNPWKDIKLLEHRLNCPNCKFKSERCI